MGKIKKVILNVPEDMTEVNEAYADAMSEILFNMLSREEIRMLIDVADREKSA